MIPELEFQKTELASITFLGDESSGGVYILRMHVNQAVAIHFGRFANGRPIIVPAGEYLYIGSALRGMARRLLRHASRADSENPQSIRRSLRVEFNRLALIKDRFPLYPSKRLHWHIDYLLDNENVFLTHVIIFRSSMRMESAVAQWLVQQSETKILAPGLGASDVPGATHLLQVKANESWWQRLPFQLTALNQTRQ